MGLTWAPPHSVLRLRLCAPPPHLSYRMLDSAMVPWYDWFSSRLWLGASIRIHASTILIGEWTQNGFLLARLHPLLYATWTRQRLPNQAIRRGNLVRYPCSGLPYAEWWLTHTTGSGMVSPNARPLNEELNCDHLLLSRFCFFLPNEIGKGSLMNSII